MSGSASVQRVVIGPGGRTFVVLQSPSQVGGVNCTFFEVTLNSEVPTCVDSSVGMINWPFQQGANPGIQFDASGAVYYMASLPSTGSEPSNVLRRRSATGITDLVSGNIGLSDFLVLPDGRVLITGETLLTHVRWVRMVYPGGSLQSVVPTTSQFLTRFPDGNVYMGLWNTGYFGVARFLTGSSSLDSKFWISDELNGQPADAYFKAGDYCSEAERPTREGFCGSFGSVASSFVATPDGKVFAISGGSGIGGVLTQYYPTISFPETAVRDVAAMTGAGSKLIVAGLDSLNRNILISFDPSTNEETELIGPSNETEIYHLRYVTGTNSVLFDGLRFSDNKYVLGSIDLGTGEVSVAAAGAQKWQEVQAFE